MRIAPDAPQDILRLLAARALTANVRRRHRQDRALTAPYFFPEGIPEELRQRPPMPDEQNGYLLAKQAVGSVPTHGLIDPDLSFRAVSLLRTRCRTECLAAHAALDRYGPSLDLIEQAFTCARWQAPNPEDGANSHELHGLRTLGTALCLRGALLAIEAKPDQSSKDFERAILLSWHIRNCEGSLLHLVVGLALDSQIQRVLRALLKHPSLGSCAISSVQRLAEEDRLSDLRQAYVGEFGRAGIPKALRSRGPWEPVPQCAPLNFKITHFAAQWLMDGHTCAYDPEKTAVELAAICEAFVSWVDLGWPAAELMEAMRRQYTSAWPEFMTRISTDRFCISAREMLDARPALSKVENAHGLLQCARTMHAAGEVFRAATLAKLRLEGTQVAMGVFLLGRRPECLEELVACGCLNRVPEDPFTQAALLMNETDRAIWSPGPHHLRYEEVRRCFGKVPDSPYFMRL